MICVGVSVPSPGLPSPDQGQLYVGRFRYAANSGTSASRKENNCQFTGFLELKEIGGLPSQSCLVKKDTSQETM